MTDQELVFHKRLVRLCHKVRIRPGPNPTLEYHGLWDLEGAERRINFGTAHEGQSQLAMEIKSEKDDVEGALLEIELFLNIAGGHRYMTQRENPAVQGRCPTCRGETLFLGNSGYVTCSVIGCREPASAHELLSDDRAQRVMNILNQEFKLAETAGGKKVLEDIQKGDK